MAVETMRELGKLLVVFGIALVVVGGLLTLGSSRGIGLPGRLGRLPGDIVIQRENFTVYFPLMTCVLVSAVLTLLFWLIGRMKQ